MCGIEQNKVQPAKLKVWFGTTTFKLNNVYTRQKNFCKTFPNGPLQFTSQKKNAQKARSGGATLVAASAVAATKFDNLPRVTA